jgi:hypothetical protein
VCIVQCVVPALGFVRATLAGILSPCARTSPAPQITWSRQARRPVDCASPGDSSSSLPLLLTQVAKGRNLAIVHFGMSLFFEAQGMYRYPRGVDFQTTKAMIAHMNLRKLTSAVLRRKTKQVEKAETESSSRYTCRHSHTHTYRDHWHWGSILWAALALCLHLPRTLAPAQPTATDFLHRLGSSLHTRACTMRCGRTITPVPSVLVDN